MDEVLGEFLQGRHIAVLGTTSRDGSVHLANVWYVFDDVLYIQTPDSSLKAKNVVRMGTASIVIDSRGPGPWRGTATSGPAELITEPERVAPIRQQIMAHYVSPEGMEDPKVGGRMRLGDNSIIRLTPTKWKWWNVSDMFQGYIDTPGYILPLSD
jgi:PPOX class probable F420-dependent enzyme